MKRLATSVSVLATMAGGALAGGLDRTGQPIQALFEPGGENGNYAEISFGKAFVNLDGVGVGIDSYSAIDPSLNVPAGTKYNNVGQDFTALAGAIKLKFNDEWSGAIIFEQPYGADVIYPGDPATTELGGTSAIADTESATFYLRYKFDDRWSVHGGPRIQRVKGDITLSGRAYGLPQDQAMAAAGAAFEQAALVAPFDPALAGQLQQAGVALGGTANGYKVSLDQDYALGYVIGGAFEIPEIAARVSLTYNSAITHEMASTETGPTLLGYGAVYDGTSTTEVKTPQSVNLEFRTGIAPDTLLFGSIRWVDWSEFKIDPKYFVNATGEGLVDLDDTTTYALGIGRKFSDTWAGSVALIYEAAGDDLVSPLAPTSGFFAVAINAAYTVGDVVISAGVRQTWLGDAIAETGTPDVARADFSDNTVTAVGFRIGYNF